MEEAQHSTGSTGGCRLEIVVTEDAKIEASAEAVVGAAITQIRNSQERAQARVGEGIVESWIQGRNKSCPEMSNDVDGVQGEMTDAERHIRSLLAFRGLKQTKMNMCKLALEEWQSIAELFIKRVDERNLVVLTIKNEIYQVLGFLAAFQGLLLFSVAQSSLLQCHNVGFPLALSAFVTAGAVIGTYQKNAIIRDLKRTTGLETPTVKQLVARVQELKYQGEDFNFRTFENKTMCNKYNKGYTSCSRLFSYTTGVAIYTITFGALCMAAMYQSACSRGTSGHST